MRCLRLLLRALLALPLSKPDLTVGEPPLLIFDTHLLGDQAPASR